MECKNCQNQEQAERFCSNCGHKLHYERIRMPSVFREVLNTYTHLEQGFVYVVRQLAAHPGTVQKKYLSGYRSRLQKPFPMFVICGTLCALALYLTNKPYNSLAEQYFYRNYYVILQALMLPAYAFITWVLFASSRLYYAEVLVLNVYMVGFMLLLVVPINVFHFAFNTAVISFIEIGVLAGYNVWTNLNFFSNKPKWLVLLKSLFNIVVCYLLFQTVAQFLIEHL